MATELINGMQMSYEIHATGEPLVLLHGFTGCGADWRLYREPDRGAGEGYASIATGTVTTRSAPCGCRRMV